MTQRGGLIGSAQTTVTSSYSTATVAGVSYVGGLTGNGYGGKIIYSYATGNVSGTTNVGGLRGSGDPGSAIQNSYATGDVSGTTNVGGLMGNQNHSNGTITKSYSTGSVSGTTDVGGLIGRTSNAGGTTYSYWDTQTSNQSTSVEGTGKTTTQMQNIDTYKPGGSGDWDIIEDSSLSAGAPIFRYNDDGTMGGWRIAPVSSDNGNTTTTTPKPKVASTIDTGGTRPQQNENNQQRTFTVRINLAGGNVEIDSSGNQQVTVQSIFSDGQLDTTDPRGVLQQDLGVNRLSQIIGDGGGFTATQNIDGNTQAGNSGSSNTNTDEDTQ